MASYFDDEEEPRQPFDPEEARRQSTPHDFQAEVPPAPAQDEDHPANLDEEQNTTFRNLQVANPGAGPGPTFPHPAPQAPAAPPGPPRLTDGSTLAPDEQSLAGIMSGLRGATLGQARQRQLQRLQNGQATVDDLVMNGTLGPVEAEQYRQMINRQMEPLMIRQNELPIYMQRLQFQRARMQMAHETAVGVENERFRSQTAQGRIPSATAADGSTWVQSGNGTWHQTRPEQRPAAPQRDPSAITPQHLATINHNNLSALQREMAEAAKPVEAGGHRGGVPAWAQPEDVSQTALERAGLESSVQNGNATPEQLQRLQELRNPPTNLNEFMQRELNRRNRQAVGFLREHVGQGQQPGQPPSPLPTPGQPGAPGQQASPTQQAPDGPQQQQAPQQPPPIAAVAAYRAQANTVQGGEILNRSIDEMHDILTRYPTFSQAPRAVQERYNYLRTFIPRALQRGQRRQTSAAPAGANPGGMRPGASPLSADDMR